MKKTPLLPRYFRWLGITLLLLGLSFHYCNYYDKLPSPFAFYLETFAIYYDGQEGEHWFSFVEVDFGLTFTVFSYIIGLAFIAFSKNKVEDEMINGIRLYSWSWAIILTLMFILLSTLFIYGMVYLSYVFLYVPFMLIMYLIIFWVNIWVINKKLSHEE